MNIVQTPISKLTLDPNNARKHSEKNLRAIAASLEKFGQRKPIVVHRGVVIAGNGTVEAAKSLGWTDISIAAVPDEWDADTAKAYALADNRSAELAEWDESELAKQLLELQDADWDITELGFDVPALADIEPVDEDEIPEPPVEPKTKLGDIYQLGRHRLMCGDSTDKTSVERLMDGLKADLLHTDPPYNVDYDNSSRPNPGKSLGKIQNDVMNNESFYTLLKNAFAQAYLFLKDDSSAYIWHSDREMVNFKESALEAGFKFAQTIIWKKPMLLSRTRYQWAHEPCLFFVKGSPYFTLDRTKTTVWDFGGYDKSKNVHPTQKPIFIPTEAIMNSTEKDALVLDLFGGSGSTLIAAEQTNRTAYLMELDPKYCDVIVTRWENLTGNQATLVNSK